jgi:hypothetical protein
MRSHLQVKVFTLSAEMTYIRRQEEKWKTRARKATAQNKSVLFARSVDNFWSLRHHRVDLKVEARSTHLAYGFLRNQTYACMEQICYGPLKGFGSYEPNWKSIEEMVERFSKDETDPQGRMQKFAEWLADAKVWYEANPQRIDLLNADRPNRIARLKEASASRKPKFELT